MVGKSCNIALCSKCYDGKIVANQVDDLLVFFCNKCFIEVEIETFK